MIVQIQSGGVTEGMLLAILEGLVSYNAAVYRAYALRPIESMGVVYVPDAPGGTITLAAVDMLAQYPGHRGKIDRVSCSSAAAAWAGYQRSRGVAARVDMRRVSRGGEPMEWHATGAADLPVAGAAPRIMRWDPAMVLSRRRVG